MSAVIRSLWTARLLATLPVLVFFAAAAWYVPSLPTTAALLAAAASGAAAAAGTAALTRELARGDRGELLLKAGGRLPIRVSRTARRTAQLEVLVDAIGVVLAGAEMLRGDMATAALLMVGVLGLLLSVVLEVQRSWSAALTESLVALMNDDLDRAERALGPAERSRLPSVRDGVIAARAQIELRRGRPEAAIRKLEAAWSGVLDDRAALLGLYRLGRGDPDLAERWLGARHLATRYDRYLEALVGGRLAVHRQQWDRAMELLHTGNDLPKWYQDQLDQVEAAALQGAGRGEDARGLLVAREIDVPAWLARVDPLQHQLLADAVAGRVTSAAHPRAPTAVPPVSTSPRSADPFAAPARSVAPVRRRRRDAGALPVESLGLAPAQSRLGRVLRMSSAVVIIGLGGLMLVLVGLLSAVAAMPSGGFAALGVVCIGSGALSLLSQGSTASARHPAVALSDGRRITASLFWTWGLASLGPFAALGSLVVLGGLVGPPSTWVWVVAGAALLVPVVGGIGAVRIHHLRLVRCAHFDPPAAVGARAAAIAAGWGARGGTAGLWVALGRLWSGDAAEAEREVDQVLIGFPWVDGLKTWFRAGRGELDLDRVLAEPEPVEPGERYRWAVALALAALRAGRRDRLGDRVGAWNRLADELPNRFGALLRHLAGRIAGDVSPRDPDLDFLAIVWPFAA